MHIHINLWLSQGRPPSDGQEVELIVSDIDYPSLSITPASQLVPCTSGEFPITVTSITSWTVSDDASWLSCSPDSGSNNGEVTVSYEANTTTSSRTAIVTFACNGVPDKICIVTQAAAPTPEISVSLEIEFVDNGLCRLNWNEIPGATSYLVYSADEPLPYDSPAWTQIAQTANQYLVIQASDARKFFYVKAVVDSVSADFISVPVMQ